MLLDRVQVVTCVVCLKICGVLCRIVSTCGPHHDLYIDCVKCHMLGRQYEGPSKKEEHLRASKK